MTPIPRSLCIASLAAVAALPLALPAAAQRVGISSAVNPATTGAPPGATARQLVIGENIVYNEHINTGSDGQTQILFVDESALSIGPNSDMTIDKFVYDPKTGAGTEALSATRGIFRYVGGKLSKLAAPVTIRTPSASIGIRGGVFLLDLTIDGRLYVVFLYGDGLTVTGLTGITQTITRPGFAVTVAGRGAAPTPPGPAPRTLIDGFLAALDGRAGGNGGNPQPPTDASVAGSGISNTISGNITPSIQAANQGQFQTPTQNLQPNTNTNLNTVNGQTQVNNSTQNTGQTSPINQTGISGAATTTSNVGNGTGFAGQLVPYSGASVQNGVFIATIGKDSVSLNLGGGTGTVRRTGTSNQLGSFNATVTIAPDNSFFYASAAPIGHPNELAFVYGGTPVNQNVYNATGSPQFYAFQVNPDVALDNNIPFIRNQTGGAIASPTVSPLYLAVSPTTGFGTGVNSGSAFPKALQASLAISGQGAGQMSALVVGVGNVFSVAGNPGQTTAMPVLNGIVEGSYNPGGGSPTTRINSSFLTGIDGVGNSFYGKNSITGFVLDSNNCCSGGQQFPGTAQEVNPQTGAVTTYNFVQPATAATLPAVGSGPQTTQTLAGFAGGTMTAYQNGQATPYAVIGGTGTGIQTDARNLQVAGTIAVSDPFTRTQSGVNSMVLSFGSLSPGNTNARQGYINDSLFGMLESPNGTGSSLNGTAGSAKLYLVDANAVPNTALLPAGVTYCQCQYLQWGYWGGELDTSSPNARADVAHINTWVAGPQTSATDINNLISMGATGTYSGAAVGSVINNGASYLAAGGFSQTYHFGTQTGTMTISNFDGRTFGGTVVGARGSPAAFAAPLSGNGLTGSAIGSFFGPGAIETGGAFAVGGTAYSAAGTFAGHGVVH